MEKREKDSVTADGWGLLKMERYYLKKEQRVFMVEQYFKNNEGFSNKIIFGDEIIFMMDWLLDEIVVLGVQKIHEWSLRNKCNVSLFDALDFGSEADHSSSKMRLIRR